MKGIAYLAALLLGGSFLSASAADSQYARFESLDQRFDALIPPDTKVEKIADDLLWSEGPLWDATHEALLFSDIPRNVVMQWHADKGVSSFLERSGYTGAAPFTGKEPGSNGLTFDLQGRLTLCQHGDRRISRREADGTMVPLATSFRASGSTARTTWCSTTRARLYFTDPPYRLARHVQGSDQGIAIPGRVPRRHDGKITLLTKELEAPNGLAFSPDYKTLYVANSQRDTRRSGRPMPSRPTAASAQGRVFADSSKLYKEGDGVPDGLKVDVKGNVFATGPGGVLVYSPDGTLLGRILTGVPTANVAFGEDGATLFITANHRVLRLRTRTKGMPLPVAN